MTDEELADLASRSGRREETCWICARPEVVADVAQMLEYEEPISQPQMLKHLRERHKFPRRRTYLAKHIRDHMP